MRFIVLSLTLTFSSLTFACAVAQEEDVADGQDRLTDGDDDSDDSKNKSSSRTRADAGTTRSDGGSSSRADAGVHDAVDGATGCALLKCSEGDELFENESECKENGFCYAVGVEGCGGDIWCLDTNPPRADRGSPSAP